MSGCESTPGSDADDLVRLRTLMRAPVLPNDDVLAQLEDAHRGTPLGALARLARARVRFERKDWSGAATILAADLSATGLEDYALFMRARAMEELGRRVEARAIYEELARKFPRSPRIQAARVRAAELAVDGGQGAAVPTLLKDLLAQNDPSALLIAARAMERSGDTRRAIDFYRRLYFFVPASAESAEAAAAILRLQGSLAAENADEARTRADRLFEAKLFKEAADAYGELAARFPRALDAQANLRRGIAAYNARRFAESLSALIAVPASSGEAKAEALYYTALVHAQTRQWTAAQNAADDLRRLFPQSPLAPRLFTALGYAARDAKDISQATRFWRAGVEVFRGATEVAAARFELAWSDHQARNYAAAARGFIEYLALYADRHTDFRGRAAYWAARDAERVGRLSDARALYEALQKRYDATWYGYLAKQRLAGIGKTAASGLSDEVAKAIANLETVSVAAETAGPAEDERLARAEKLAALGLDDWAFEELQLARTRAPASPRVNLALARLHRLRGETFQAFSALRQSYPDYAQMRPEELSREEWEIFYPLLYWEAIKREARARGLDPYAVAGLIRQESVFDARAVSRANARGLMQLLVPTARLVSKRYGLAGDVSADALHDPETNIRLGTAYFKDQIERFGKLEYAAAAYNAGPNRVVQWLASLPPEIDEWVEAIPFSETRGYVQGVVRNMLQYKRLYDESGNFRPEVGRRITAVSAPVGTRPRRTSKEDD
ncbi:transglycosylase SLT domain-containing protein [Pyrinomonas sp.]|uniref:lytic transglycosylase domain-containing protein n=1 Tax=Pyrinomonas sp. TaxID=2080306 RepID=UPI003323EDEC